MIVNRKDSLVAMLLVLVVLIPDEVHAYIGPGAGLSAIGSLLAVLGAILLGIVGFVWYPLKRLLRRKEKVLDEDCEETLAESSNEAKSVDSSDSS